MLSSSCFSGSRMRQHLHIFLLILLWIAGLVAGIFMTELAQSISTLMDTAVASRVSIVPLAFVTLLPLLLSALAVYMRFPRLILPIVFMKACMEGVVYRADAFSFGTSSWLVRLLLMFSDSIALIPVCWFWIRYLQGSTPSVRRNTVLCCIIIVVACLLDRFYVSSLLMTLA